MYVEVERMEENWLVMRIVVSDVRGRPQMEWMDSVERMLNERNVYGARKDDYA